MYTVIYENIKMVCGLNPGDTFKLQTRPDSQSGDVFKFLEFKKISNSKKVCLLEVVELLDEWFGVIQQKINRDDIGWKDTYFDLSRAKGRKIALLVQKDFWLFCGKNFYDKGILSDYEKAQIRKYEMESQLVNQYKKK